MSSDVPDLAIILAGGIGIRLAPITQTIPKPMVEINNKPVIGYILDHLLAYGINNIVISIGYKADIIKNYVRNNQGKRANIIFVEEEVQLGTGGALRNVAKSITFPFANAIVMFGDDITDIDFRKMFRFHMEKKAPITIAALEVNDVSGSGVMEVDGDIITNFVEKPDPKTVKSNLINGGIHIFTADAMRLLPETQKFSLTQDFFESVAKKRILYAYKTKYMWYPIDTPERYERAKRELETRDP